jgi:hypothetical protein
MPSVLALFFLRGFPTLNLFFEDNRLAVFWTFIGVVGLVLLVLVLVLSTPLLLLIVILAMNKMVEQRGGTRGCSRRHHPLRAGETRCCR